jgi:hypothetical protein
MSDKVVLEESTLPSPLLNPLPSSSDRLVDDGDSIAGSDTSNSTVDNIDDEMSLEIQPYLEIGKELNVSLM